MDKLINLIKKRPIISSFIIAVCANQYTELPLRSFLSSFMTYQAALMLSIFILQMSCFGLLLYLSHRLDCAHSFNLRLSQPIKSLWLIIPFFIFIIANIIDCMKPEHITDNPPIFILYSFAFLSTGFFEEILFRGILFNLINDKFGSTNKGFFFSVFASSIFFGSAHIVNFFNGTMPLINFINQCIYASIIGVLFTALYLRCNTLLIPIIIHGLIDITGCTEFLAITSEQLFTSSRVQSVIDYKTIIATLILFLPFLLWSLFLLRKVKPEKNSSLKLSIQKLWHNN